FVNAVLRRAGTADFAPKFSSETERLSVTYSVGLPIVKLLQQEYPDRAEALLAASFCTPKLAVRVNALKITPEKLIELLAQQNVTVEKTALPNALFLFGVGDITRLPAFQQGLFHVQGLASQLACAALDVQPGERVLDLCAAPGGKSATIAQQLAGSGSLVACELYESRLPLINTLIARIGAHNVTTLQNDAAIYREELFGMDKVLCDVPCSGLGTMAKKPDIRYKDLAELPKLLVMQRAILASGARSVKRGGRLVYSTCTINPDENERIVRDFLVKNPDFVLRKLDFSMFECEQIDEMCLFLPQNGRMDGFFIATLERL
ncbi:MAG: SAM-dependent methyltransferase, partial [Pygmaiobacter sp.]